MNQVTIKDVGTLSDGGKLVIVLALSEPVLTESNEELLISAINDINILPVLTMRVVETASDNSTIKTDIEVAFSDVISRTQVFVTYDVADINQYTVAYDLTPVWGLNNG